MYAQPVIIENKEPFSVLQNTSAAPQCSERAVGLFIFNNDRLGVRYPLLIRHHTDRNTVGSISETLV